MLINLVIISTCNSCLHLYKQLVKHIHFLNWTITSTLKRLIYCIASSIIYISYNYCSKSMQNKTSTQYTALMMHGLLQRVVLTLRCKARNAHGAQSAAGTPTNAAETRAKWTTVSDKTSNLNHLFVNCTALITVNNYQCSHTPFFTFQYFFHCLITL